MKILISGGTGFVGKASVGALERGGHEVRRLVRDGQAEGVRWNVETGEIDQNALRRWDGPEAVVHLAGENLAARRWRPEQKRRIRTSRVEATERLTRSLAAAGTVRTFVGASAVGYYGDRGEEVLTEKSAKGDGFLAEICEGWEAAAEPLRQAGVRVAHLRFGMVLSGDDGALAKMLPVFRLGIGGRLGSGQQWVSWISRRDAVRAIEFVMGNDSAQGAFNAVAPEPACNREFAKELGRALRRPAVLPVPGFALRMVFGEMADAMLLSSARVLPERLLEAGFRFEHETISRALAACV